MKSIGCLTGLSSLALLLGACTSVTPEGGDTAAPAAPQLQTAEKGNKQTPAESAEEKTDEDSGFFSWMFGSSKEEEPVAPQAVEVKPEVTPTPAQQAAAQKVLSEEPDIPAPRAEDSSAELMSGRNGGDFVPARNGLRLGRFAPPEEAASNAEDTTPRPNAVELRGLRSPMLRGGRLPMDINGKLTTDKENHE